MRTFTTKRAAFVCAVGALAVLVVLLALSSRDGAARAAVTPETKFPSYSTPTGAELSTTAAANAAVGAARKFGEAGQVKLELARATLAQAHALVEGETVASARAHEAALAPASAPSATFCFAGGGQNANCSAAEQQHAKAVLYAESQAPTYIVTMYGTSFAPESERLPPGASPVTGNIAVLILDAHTGARIGMTIGAGTTAPNLAELASPVSAFVAGPQSSSAQAAASVRPTHPLNSGSVRGTFSGREVVVYNARGVFGRAKPTRGHFEIPSVAFGTYRVAGRVTGRRCPSKSVSVRRGRETTVHLRC